MNSTNIEGKINQLMKNNRKKIVIYGVGKFWENYKNNKYLKQFEIVDYIDKKKCGTKVNEKVVLHPEQVVKVKFDFILIMSQNFVDEMKKELIQYGIDQEKILDWGQFIFRQRYQNAEKTLGVIGKKEIENLGVDNELFRGYDIAEIYDVNQERKEKSWEGIPICLLDKFENRNFDKILILHEDFERIKKLIKSHGVAADKIVDMKQFKKCYTNLKEVGKPRVVLLGYRMCSRFVQIEQVKRKYEISAILCDELELQYIGDKFDGISILPVDCASEIESELYVCPQREFTQKKKYLINMGIDEYKIIDSEEFEEQFSIRDEIKLLVFGTGLYLKNRLDNEIFKLGTIIGYIDNDEKKWGSTIRDVDIMQPEEGIKLDYDLIVIMSKFYDEMKKQLLELGVDKEKICNFVQVCGKILGEKDNYIADEILVEGKYEPLVSVIVPNYNHEKYLKERLESVYNQTYKNIEVLLLDDCSRDGSRDILDAYADKYKDITTKYYNQANAGKAFLQWEKGINLAKGELIWIAESDDYSENIFLEKLVNEFRRESVMLAFARSVFIQNGEQIWTQEEYLNDIVLNWKKSFIMSAHQLVKKGFCEKNFVPNVSSAVFRNPRGISQEVSQYWKKLNLCGDWMFYLDLVKGGCISYVADVTNYYRVHEGSTSLKVQKQYEYFKEQAEISKYVIRNYNCNVKFIYQVQNNLKKHFKLNFKNEDEGGIDKYYNIKEIKAAVLERKPNIAMCIFGICSGGGETYPMFLANEMRRKGFPVTIFDLGIGEYNTEIRKKINPDVPVVRIKNRAMLYIYIKEYGVEVIHSHHASVDEDISDCLKSNDNLNVKQIITLHGMYESIAEENARRTISKVANTCSCFVYIADKNLQPFKKSGKYEKLQQKFIKMPNGLPQIDYCPVNRKKLGIREEDFVLCLVSRALVQKGWYEAIEAVTRAQNNIHNRNIHLLLIGDGEVYDEIKKQNNPFVHVMGALDNVRDYFAMSDMGILPTYFKGESYPLVVIECLMCGKPVIATDIAEVKNQLTDENGQLAGKLIHLYDGKINIDELTDVIVQVVNDVEEYKKMSDRTLSAAAKFDISKIVDDYVRLYKKILQEN